MHWVPGLVGLGLPWYKDRQAVGRKGWVTGEVEPGKRAVGRKGQKGWLTGEVDPGKLGSEGLAAPYQLGWVPGKVESRALVSVGDLGVGREDEKQGLDSAGFQGLPGVSWTGLVSGLVDLVNPGSMDWSV